MINTKNSIIFINPPGHPKLYRSIVCTFISKANYLWQPQDFINLSAQVPKDYNLKHIDCCINNLNGEDLSRAINSCKPELAIIALSSVVYNNDICFLKNFKSHFPGMKLLVLGDIFLERAFWDEGLKYADGIILNSLDIDLKHYIKEGTSHSSNLVLKDSYSKTKDIIYSKTPDFKKTSIGIPRHELFINRRYRFPFSKSFLYTTVSTQFGCLFNCNYCSWSKINVTYRDYNEVLEEIEKIHSLGVRDLFFGDPSFGMPRENVRLLLGGMISKKYSMRWVCYAYPGLLDGEFLGLMKKAGCHTVIIGVDDSNLEILNEKYNRRLSRSRLIEFCKECQSLDIRVCGDFIIGLNNDEKAINQMIEFANELKLDYASFNIFTVLLGSMLREELVKQGKIDPFMIGFDTSGTYGHGNERLVKLRNSAIRKFYLHPRFLLNRLTKIDNLAELKIQFDEMSAMFKGLLIKN